MRTALRPVVWYVLFAIGFGAVLGGRRSCDFNIFTVYCDFFWSRLPSVVLSDLRPRRTLRNDPFNPPLLVPHRTALHRVGHCKRLAPTWDELAEKLDGQVNVVKVDCTVHENVCKALNVKGYPTLKLIKGDRMQTYKGARDVETLAEFALNQDWEAETGYETTPTVPDPAAARAAIQAKAAAAAEEAEAGGEVLELTASNFGVLTGSGLTFVKVRSQWASSQQVVDFQPRALSPFFLLFPLFWCRAVLRAVVRPLQASGADVGRAGG